jgi:hypothetical protein
VQQGLRGVGVPNREVYEDLLFRIEQLEHRVRLLEGQPTSPGPEAPAEPLTPPPASPGHTPTPPLADIDAEPTPPGEPPRDEPDTPPGLQPGR